MATHSSVLAWRIPGTGESGGLPSMGLHRVGHDWSNLAAAAAVDIRQTLNLLHNAKPPPEWTAAAKSLQSCPTLCNPIDGSPPDSPVPGILQARTLEWVVISFSNAWKWKVKVKSLSRVQPSVTPWLQPTRLLRPWDFPGKSTTQCYISHIRRCGCIISCHLCWFGQRPSNEYIVLCKSM